jgi:hypothetical protein
VKGLAEKEAGTVRVGSSERIGREGGGNGKVKVKEGVGDGAINSTQLYSII